MANTELATAYVSIVPSTRGFVPSLNKQLGGNGGVEKSGKTLGSRLAKGMKVSAVAAGAAVGAVLTKAVVGGFKRLTAIENAEAKLSGLGHSAKGVTGIMDDALKSVKGTAFGLDEAATTAAGAVAAGIKPGKDLEGVLGLVADAATIGGVSMGEMGSIFNKVASKGKVQGDVLKQLGDQGIPILQFLSEELGVSAEETAKLASKGAINFDTFRSAMENNLAGAALKSGDTTIGAFKNMNAALSRFGVTLLDEIYPYIGPAFKGITGYIDGASEKIEPILARISKGIKGVFELVVNGDFTEAFREAFNVEEDSRLVGFILGVRDAFKGLASFTTDTLVPALSGLSDWMKAHPKTVKAIATVITVALLPVLARWGTESLIAAAKNVAAWATARGAAVKTGAAYVVESYRMVASWARIAAGAAKHQYAAVYVWWVFSEEARKARIASFKASAAIVGRWALMSAQSLVHAARMALAWVIAMGPVAWVIAGIVGLAAIVALNWDKIVGWTSKAWGAVMEYLRPVGEWISDKLGPIFQWLNESIIQPVWAAIQTTVSAAGDALAATFGWISEAVSSTLGPIFRWLYEKIVKPYWAVISFAIDTAANVILLVFDLIVYAIKNWLGPIFVWLYENIVKKFMGFIVDKISGTWDGIKAIFGFIGAGIKILGGVFVWLYDHAVKPAFDWISDKISLAWKVWKVIFKAIQKWISEKLGPIFTWLYDHMVKPAFDWISKKIKLAWAVWKVIFKAIQKWISEKLGPIFTWLYEKIVKPAFDGMKKTISFVWNKGIKPIFRALGDFINDTVAPAFQKGVDIIADAWDGLKDAAKAPVKFMVEKVYNEGIVGTFNNIADKIGSNAELKTIPLPKGFATGGYTGDGGKFDPAGIVHAGEYVLKKETTAALMKRVGVSGLDHLNETGQFPGFAKGGLVRRPVGGPVTSGFGSSRGRYPHAGIDYAVPQGTPVGAALDGRVVKAAWNAVAGRTGKGMLLEHSGGRNTYYGHLSAFVAKIGDMVKQGKTIARSGNTGNSTGPHLHFETWSGGTPLDPAKYVGGSIPEGSGGGGFFDWVGEQVGKLGGLKDKLLGNFTSKFPKVGMITDAAKHMGKEIFRILPEGLTSKIKDAGKWVGDKVGGFVSGAGHAANKAQVKGVAAKYGWSGGDQWKALSSIIQKESGWNTGAANPNSSARGLFQKMTSLHGDVAKTAFGQAKWGLNYIKGRYGDPVRAWDYWKKHRHYDTGGLVDPMPTLYDGGGWLKDTGGPQLIDHQRRKPDAILTNEEWSTMRSIADQAQSGTVYNLTVNASPEADGSELADEILFALKHADKSGVHTKGGRRP